MSTSDGTGLSDAQRRYQELTQKCGLDFEEAMYALGRRSGGLPGYRKLSRQDQFNKLQELRSSGLTQQEAERIVGVYKETTSTIPIGRSSGKGSTPPEAKHKSSKWPPKQALAGPLIRCYRCQNSDATLIQIEGGAWICKKCR